MNTSNCANNKRTRNIVSLVMLLWAVLCIIITGFYVGGNKAEAASTGTLRIMSTSVMHHPATP